MKQVTPAAAVALVLLLAACRAAAPAPESAAAAPAAEPFTVEVVHNAPIAVSVTVELVGRTGGRHRLGTVTPGQVASFEVDRLIVMGEFVLEASTIDGRMQRSDLIMTMGRTGVRWDIDRNQVTPLLDGT